MKKEYGGLNVNKMKKIFSEGDAGDVGL